MLAELTTSGDDNYPRCRQCERLGGKCRRAKGKLKFRHGSSARYDATFSKDQTWLEQTKNAKFQFVDQGPELENYYSQDDLAFNNTNPPAPDQKQEDLPVPSKRTEPPGNAEGPATAHSAPTEGRAPFLSPSSTNLETLPVQSPFKRRRTADTTIQQYHVSAETWQRGAYDPIRSQYRVYHPPKVLNSVGPNGFAYMSEQQYVPKVVEAEYRRLADSAAATIPPESLLSPAIWKEEFYWPNKFTTTQCACLMRYYIDHLASWFDVGDPARHFTLSVPQRARRCPPLLNAIFTAASRHLASLPQYKTHDGIVKYQDVLLPKLTEESALKYHNACIAYLIKLSGDPEHVRDENLLAAAVILRYYEEIDTSFTGEDSETFLHTFQVFVKAQANPYACLLNDGEHPEYLRPGSATGVIKDNAITYLKSFQHAAFRIALRQETTTAFLKQRSVRLPLDSWSILQGFDEAEDFVWSDRHLYHCANVLQFCFGSDNGSGRSQIERWNELRQYQLHWDQVKPLSFSPIHYQDPDRSKGECFPHIWYMAEVQVAGMMFLDLARILLTVYNPNIPRIGPGVITAQKRIVEEVHDIVIRLCGTAMSNPSSQPAMVQAYMAIAVCGEYFSDPAEQKALLGILDRLKNEQGWPTGKTAMELKKEWGWT
ncbi:hypothetical protein A1O1_07141 [Capronia coronata CBS 617.96]|uniref:Zn(2)-C6 fungal-type domain-containing protein n=1 Tax=Capronia coronata CBS 617.96 TaxID=1182541 RepID=W9XTG8_9EURO|nr:uncharacterized protein A1O1_07141 [Capronia coronata CBS 617.96]EXJ83518.1 hypothetical protein A1O1_07141 [Capronia coronata CBS 617.96]